MPSIEDKLNKYIAIKNEADTLLVMYTYTLKIVDPKNESVNNEIEREIKNYFETNDKKNTITQSVGCSKSSS